jgi:hypothetical protein
MELGYDPFPYVGPTGSRHAYPGTLGGERLIYAPRVQEETMKEEVEG